MEVIGGYPSSFYPSIHIPRTTIAKGHARTRTHGTLFTSQLYTPHYEVLLSRNRPPPHAIHPAFICICIFLPFPPCSDLPWSDLIYSQ